MKMNFVFDIDGTLCFNGKTIEPSIVEALDQLVEAGHQVIFASARPIRDLVPVLPAQFQQGRLVGGNGCFVAQNGQVKARLLGEDILRKLMSIVEGNQLTYLADGEWDYAFTGDTAHLIYKNISQISARQVELEALQKVCKLVLFQPTPQVMEEVMTLPVAMTHYKSEHAIDLSPLGINKVSGLRELGIGEFIAFGNDSNDQCMFEHALYSVCVGDGDVGKYATVNIAPTAVAEKIRQLLEESPNEITK